MLIGKTLLLWWGDGWLGFRFFRWDAPLDKTYVWSLACGWLEVRRLR